MAHGIEFRPVAKRFGDAASPLVVKGIDRVVPQGTLTTLLGPSGCGKTTTLRLIAGLESPSAGRILIDGVDVTTPGPAEPTSRWMRMARCAWPPRLTLPTATPAWPPPSPRPPTWAAFKN